MTAIAAPKQTAADRVIAALTERPGQTATELGESPVTMNRLVKKGVVEATQKPRGTGDRGRPSNVYILVGQEYDTSADEAAATAAALARVSAHRLYERLSRAIVVTHNEFGYGSDEHVSAKLDRLDAFPVPPVQPSDNDYKTIGQASAVTSLDDLNTKDENDPTLSLDAEV